MLDVQKVRLRFISARLLASTPYISKGLRKAIYYVRLLGILNVSKRPGMGVILNSTQFAPANLYPKNEQGGSFLGVPAVNLCLYLVSVTSFKSLHCDLSSKVDESFYSESLPVSTVR